MITLFLYFAALIAYEASQTAGQCPANYQCKTCANDTYGCIDCRPGKGLSMELYPSPNYVCTDCGAFCANCVNRTNCTECNPGYGPSPADSTICEACIIPNCLACPVATPTCAQCKSEYAFYKDSNACGACSQHCLYGCDQRFPGNCDKCDPGYGYMAGTFVCEACSPHCAVGCNQTGAGKCDKCDPGYGIASDGSCALFTSTTRATTTAIVKTATAAATTTPAISAITIEPTYGPMAGGTAITIVTTWTRPNILIEAVYIGSNIKAGNLSQSTSNNDTASKITALVRSPRITDESLIDKPLPIILEIYPDMVNVSTGMYFTYKRNTTIYDIDPRVIPLSGGIRLTVTGSNLASASNPTIRSVVFIRRSNGQSSRNESFGPCYPPNENGTQMVCLSPPIYIPEDFLLYLFGQTDQYSDVYRRRKRRDVITIDWLKGHGTPLTIRSRFKRSPNNILTNQTYELPSTGDKMQVFMDAVFDGLQVPLDSGGNFRVLNPPNISCADNIYFDSKDNGNITITGDGMNRYNGKSDYTVRIGKGFCKVTYLTNNVLTCEPPKDKPQQTESDKLYCGENFAVFIDVGNKTYRCSCLTYVDNSKTTLITIIAATVGSVLLIFIAIVVIAILVKRFRTSDKPPTQQAYIRNPMAEKRSDMMLTASRQASYNRSLNAHGTGSTTLSPERDYNRLPRPDYSGMPTNQPYGYRYNNPSFLGYAKTFEESVSDQPLRQIYLPYSRNI